MQPLDERLLALDATKRKVAVARGGRESNGSIHDGNSKGDTGASGLFRMVDAMTNTTEKVEQFFEQYASALLARDAKAIAGLYAVPSLILFPGNSIAVSDAKQTEEFFASSWDQYEGVEAVDKQLAVMGEAPHSVWADVTWSFGGQARERFCYQLIEGAKGYQIAVLTPMALTRP
jgi:ketosteroid isomerase-like protein